MGPRMLLGSVAALATLSIADAQTPFSSSRIKFTDVTQSAGVDYQQNIPGTPGSGSILAMTGGAVAGDVDGDGFADLVVTSMSSNATLFRNRGVSSDGVHMGFSDMTAVAFFPAPPPRRMNGASLADVDGDGDLDLMLTAIGLPRHFLWINDGQGHFIEDGENRGLALVHPGAHQGFSASFGDYDRDGYLDLYVTHWGHIVDPLAPLPSRSRLLRNKGASQPGFFEDVTDAANVAIEDGIANGGMGTTHQGVYSFTPKFADFDGDGWPDLAISGDFGTSRLFWNNGDGTFTDGTASAQVAADENGMGGAVADFDGDGNLDWFVSAIYDPLDSCNPGPCNWGPSGNRLYLGTGDGRTFLDGTDLGVRDGGWGWGATHLDFDNDGLLDLMLVNGVKFDLGPLDDPFNADKTRLWRNNGQTFDNVGAQFGIADSLAGKGIVKFDYDRDGDEDLFIVNAVDHPVLYRNDGGSLRNYLQIELQGSGPNTFGIGARVLLYPDQGDAPKVQEQSASSNYLSQNEPLLHFGLGQDTLVHLIEVRWPSGAVSVLNDVPSRQRIVIAED